MMKEPVIEKPDDTYELHIGERQMGKYKSRYQITFVIMIPGAFSASIATAQSSMDFVETQRISSGHTYHVELADLDGDDDLDIVFGNAAEQANEVWLNDDTGVFYDSGQRLGLNSTFEISLGDLDGDGDIDMFAANCWTNKNNFVWINQGGDQSGTPGQFLDSGQRLGDRNTQTVDLGDVDDDGDLDAVTSTFSRDLVVWINDSSGNFTEGMVASEVAKASILLDVDDDDDLDILLSNMSVWKNDGKGVFTEYSPGEADTFDQASRRNFGVGDIDGDGDPDGMLFNLDRSSLIPVLNDGSGNYTVSEDRYDFDMKSGALTSCEIVDLDMDEDLDLLVTQFKGQNRIMINDGSGGFTDAGLSLGTSGSDALGDILSLDTAVGDLDENGSPDLVFTYLRPGGDEQNSIWINSSDSTCSSADIDGDNIVGSVDLARLLGAWNSSDLSADINGDGHVGPIDLAMLLGAWGVCP